MADRLKKEIKIARRQKRLRFWRKRFSGDSIEPNIQNNLEQLLETYRMLLVKAAKASEETEIAEVEQHIQRIERQLTSMFEARRMVTTGMTLL